MLFKILRFFGIDLSARIAEAWVDVEQRFDLTRDSVERAARTAAVLTLLFLVAGLAALAAFGVGLMALYRWVSIEYGEFYGFAVVGAILALIAIAIFASAIAKSQSWSDENARRAAAKKVELDQQRAGRVNAAMAALEPPATPARAQSPRVGAAGDLSESLVLALSNAVKLPGTGNPDMDQLLAHLQDSARDVADETIEGLVRAVRYGDRPQLFAALGGAIFVGWFLGRHNHRTVGGAEQS
jgi:uncharacterized membrane protein